MLLETFGTYSSRYKIRRKQDVIAVCCNFQVVRHYLLLLLLMYGVKSTSIMGHFHKSSCKSPRFFKFCLHLCAVLFF
jgi:hypothetical protein